MDSSPDVKLAVQAEQVKNLARDMTDLKKLTEEGFKDQRDSMKWMRDNAVLQVNFEREMKEIRKDLETEIKTLEESLKVKTDQKDFDKLSSNITKLLWAFVTPACAVIIGAIIYIIGIAPHAVTTVVH